jgi:hypothetical protein
VNISLRKLYVKALFDTIISRVKKINSQRIARNKRFPKFRFELLPVKMGNKFPLNKLVLQNDTQFQAEFITLT